MSSPTAGAAAAEPVSRRQVVEVRASLAVLLAHELLGLLSREHAMHRRRERGIGRVSVGAQRAQNRLDLVSWTRVSPRRCRPTSGPTAERT
jgi:hypothetical protein